VSVVPVFLALCHKTDENTGGLLVSEVIPDIEVIWHDQNFSIISTKHIKSTLHVL